MIVSTRNFSLALLLSTGVSVAAVSQPSVTARPIATELRMTDQIVLDPLIDADSWILRLAGPDGYQRTTNSATAPPIQVVDEEGERLEDGTYHYELLPLTTEEGSLELRSAVPLRGSFRVLGGVIALSRPGDPGPETDIAVQTEEPGATPEGWNVKRSADTALVDDYCIGSGCTTIGSFPENSNATGYLKLKGADTGILFSDTNNGGSSGDWQIAVNDGIFSGANFFAVYDNGLTDDNGAFNATDAGAVPFRIDQGAPTAALRILSSGAIGLGTATPAHELDITSTSPTLRFTDTDGGLEWNLNNDPNSPTFDLVSTALGGSSTRHMLINRLAPANQLTLMPTGVGIGTASPQGNLHISGASGADVFAGIGPDLLAGPAFNFGYSGASFGLGSGFFNARPAAGAVAPNPALYFMTQNVERLMVDRDGDIGVDMDNSFGNSFNPAHPIHAQLSGAHLSAAGVWTNASSRALKENIAPLTASQALTALAALEPVRYNYVALPDDPQVGFIAEDVPDLVATPDRKTLAPTDIVAVLTRVVQQQGKSLAEARTERDALQRENEALQWAVEELRSGLEAVQKALLQDGGR